MASHLNDPALMKGQRTEAAGSETAAVADQAEFNLPYGGNSACLLVGGMVVSHIRKIVNGIHLLCRQWLGRGILNNV